jgi:Rieske Fe-S protein
MSSDLANVINEVLSDERNVRSATAPFQAEFPYQRDEEAQVTRREFCNFLFLTSSALLVGTAGFSAKAFYDARQAAAFAPMQIDGAAEMQPGSAMNFHYPSEEESAILVRAKDGSYAAFGQKCTHLSCPVHYSKTNDRLECPCHEGGFDAKTGAVLYGPPQRPLDKVDVEVRGERVFATGREVRGNEG